MNELNNTVTATGNYNNIPTSLTSNTSIVNMIEGLTLTKDADKKNWSGGYLTYTITLDNQTENSYTNAVITDVIDTNLVDFVKDSVTINGAVATSDQYSYEEGTHTLTINLNEVASKSQATLTFRVEKKS